MNSPAVSIIMPARNAGRTIESAVRSVLSQTFPDWELLVADDCSSDDTPEIIARLAAEERATEEKAAEERAAREEAFARVGAAFRNGSPAAGGSGEVRDISRTPEKTGGTVSGCRIRYLKNEVNLGAAASRNRAAGEARGEWLAFLDADDEWEPEKLKKQLAAACPDGPESSERAESFLFTGSSFLDESGRKLDAVLHVPERIGWRKLLEQNLISCSSVLIRRELYLAHPMPALPGIHEDFVTWLQILKETGLTARGIDEPLLRYRVSAASKSGNKRKAALMNWRVYRYLGLSLPACIYYEFRYAVNGLRKWRKIR